MDGQTTPPIPQAPIAPVTPVAEAPKLEKVEENKSQSTGPKNIAWDLVLQDYITPDENGRYPSHADLAKKYDVGENTVSERSTRENWVVKRGETMVKAEQIVAEKRANEIQEANASHLAKWRRIQNLGNRLLNSFEDRLNIFEKALKGIKAFQDSANATNTTDAADPIVAKKLKEIHHPGASELNIIADTLEKGIEGERIVLGLPTIVSKSDVNTRGKIELPAETINEIDRLFELNKGDDKPANTNPNS
jgi:hypothetical protein